MLENNYSVYLIDLLKLMLELNYEKRINFVELESNLVEKYMMYKDNEKEVIILFLFFIKTL